MDAGYDLPVGLPAPTDTNALVDLFARDKKAVDGLTLVLDGPQGVEPVVGIDPAVLRDAAEALR